MNTFLSFLIALVFFSLFFLGSSKADLTARTAIRTYGTILSVVYLVLALISSWWVALLALVVLLAAIFLWSFR